jgi:GLPGLI family protein
MKKITILYALLMTGIVCRGQYTMSGKIEYERKVNIYAQMAEMEENEWFEKLKSQIPKFQSSYFDLEFDTTRSIYKPGKEAAPGSVFKMFGGGPATENVVLSNFTTSRVKAQKTIYEQKFLVEDSLRKIDWVEKDEIRTIANYKCHKAVGKICDSVYVVAFYTEDIMVSSGPEMFGGLPGMIMELAIPRLHTTWVADKVDLMVPPEADFTVSEKGKKIDEKGLQDAISASFKDWGKMAARNIWWSVL